MKASTRFAAPLLAAALLGAGMLPAAAEEDTQELAAAKPSEVQRFCTNIADAARDARYAFQRQELKTLKAEIEKTVAELERRRAEYEEWLRRRNEFLKRAEDNLVEIYKNMDPETAALQLARVHREVAAAIVMKMEPRAASAILNEMEVESAAMLTGIIANAAARPDPEKSS